MFCGDFEEFPELNEKQRRQLLLVPDRDPCYVVWQDVPDFVHVS